jgi:hypothetical protein
MTIIDKAPKVRTTQNSIYPYAIEKHGIFLNIVLSSKVCKDKGFPN